MLLRFVLAGEFCIMQDVGTASPSNQAPSAVAMTLTRLRLLLGPAVCGLLLVGCGDRGVRPPAPDDSGIAPAAKKVDEQLAFRGRTLSGWLAILRDKNAKARLEAVTTLGKDYIGLEDPGRPVALQALAHALKDSDETVRSVAAEALRRCGADAVPAFLAAMKDDQDTKVRRTAASGLADLCQYGGAAAAEPAVPRLGEVLMQDKDRQIQWSVAMALGRIGRPAVPALAEAVRSGERGSREAAVNALGRMHPPPRAAVLALVEALKGGDEALRSQAAFALSGMGDGAGEALPALLTASKGNDDAARVAREAAQKIHKAPRSAAPELIKHLKDAEP